MKEIKIWSSIEIDPDYEGSLFDAPDCVKTYVLRANIGGKLSNISMLIKDAEPMIMLKRLIDFIKKDY